VVKGSVADFKAGKEGVRLQSRCKKCRQLTRNDNKKIYEAKNQPTAVCNKCGVERKNKYFQVDNHRKNGMRGTCVLCHSNMHTEQEYDMAKSRYKPCEECGCGFLKRKGPENYCGACGRKKAAITNKRNHLLASFKHNIPKRIAKAKREIDRLQKFLPIQVCTNCGKLRERSEFYGNDRQCSDCIKAKARERSQDPQKKKERSIYAKKRYRENEEHRNKVKQQAIAYNKEARKRTEVKIIINVRKRIKRCLSKGKKIGKHINKYIQLPEGLTLDEHLESQFESQTEVWGKNSNGEAMSWDNYGEGLYKWHIDHHVSLKANGVYEQNISNAERERRLKKAWHYKNLKPLWGKYNIAKSATTIRCAEDKRRIKEQADAIW
jgi:hypothetical protein